MIRWTGLPPWGFEFSFSGSLTSTSLEQGVMFRTPKHLLNPHARPKKPLTRASQTASHVSRSSGSVSRSSGRVNPIPSGRDVPEHPGRFTGSLKGLTHARLFGSDRKRASHVQGTCWTHRNFRVDKPRRREDGSYRGYSKLRTRTAPWGVLCS